MRFAVGDRIRVSELGRERVKVAPGCMGTITGFKDRLKKSEVTALQANPDEWDVWWVEWDEGENRREGPGGTTLHNPPSLAEMFMTLVERPGQITPWHRPKRKLAL